MALMLMTIAVKEKGKTMSDTKLKPCPFCGGTGHVIIKTWDLFTHGALVECEGCGARTVLVEPSCEYTAKDKAVELWNARIK